MALGAREHSEAEAVAGKNRGEHRSTAEESAANDAGPSDDGDLVEVGGREGVEQPIGQNQQQHRNDEDAGGGRRACEEMLEETVGQMHRARLVGTRVALRGATAAVACAILLLWYSVLSSATNDDCGPDPLSVAIILPEGDRLLVSAPADRVEIFAQERLQSLNKELARIETLGRDTFAASMVAPFAGVHGQLPEFAGWAYSWIGNYIFSYQVMYAAGKAGSASMLSGAAPITAAKEAVAATVGQEFDARVLVPARLREHLETALADARGLVYEELERFFRAERSAWLDFAAESCRASSPARNAQRVAVNGAYLPTSPTETVDTVALDHNVTRVFAVRALRPFGVRIAIPTLAAFGIGGTGGLGAGLVLSAGLVWSLDYAVNAIDSSMNRSKLELMLVARMQSEERRLAEEAGGELRAGLEAGNAGYRDGLVALAASPAIARRVNRESPILAPLGP